MTNLEDGRLNLNIRDQRPSLNGPIIRTQLIIQVDFYLPSYTLLQHLHLNNVFTLMPLFNIYVFFKVPSNIGFFDLMLDFSSLFKEIPFYSYALVNISVQYCLILVFFDLMLDFSSLFKKYQILQKKNTQEFLCLFEEILNIFEIFNKNALFYENCMIKYQIF